VGSCEDERIGDASNGAGPDASHESTPDSAIKEAASELESTAGDTARAPDANAPTPETCETAKGLPPECYETNSGFPFFTWRDSEGKIVAEGYGWSDLCAAWDAWHEWPTRDVLTFQSPLLALSAALLVLVCDDEADEHGALEGR
jgi:hypothetical protein